MRRAVRVVLPFAVLAVLGLGALALTGPLKLPQFDLASLIGSDRSPPATMSAPAQRSDLGQRSDPKSDHDRTRVATVSPPATGVSRTESRASSPSGQASGASALLVEVARIDPDGVSVLGGRAPAGSKVTVLANGEPIAVATASEDGQWTAIVTRQFQPGALDLSIVSDSPGNPGVRSPAVRLDVPKGSGRIELAAASPAPRPILPPRPSTGETRAVNEFAAVVERARAAGGSGEGSGGRPPLVPVPITFVTGEDIMTPEGARAANLLVDYIRIMKPEAMTLSGHADVRGGDGYNVELSRRRLEAIERHLRGSGYTGRLSLQPKGKSEPYQGIDRNSLPIEAVYQADRRVEFRLAE